MHSANWNAGSLVHCNCDCTTAAHQSFTHILSERVSIAHTKTQKQRCPFLRPFCTRSLCLEYICNNILTWPEPHPPFPHRISFQISITLASPNKHQAIISVSLFSISQYSFSVPPSPGSYLPRPYAPSIFSSDYPGLCFQLSHISQFRVCCSLFFGALPSCHTYLSPFLTTDFLQNVETCRSLKFSRYHFALQGSKFKLYITTFSSYQNSFNFQLATYHLNKMIQETVYSSIPNTCRDSRK